MDVKIQSISDVLCSAWDVLYYLDYLVNLLTEFQFRSTILPGFFPCFYGTFSGSNFGPLGVSLDPNPRRHTLLTGMGYISEVASFG